MFTHKKLYLYTVQINIKNYETYQRKLTKNLNIKRLTKLTIPSLCKALKFCCYSEKKIFKNYSERNEILSAAPVAVI